MSSIESWIHLGNEKPDVYTPLEMCWVSVGGLLFHEVQTLEVFNF